MLYFCFQTLCSKFCPKNLKTLQSIETLVCERLQPFLAFSTVMSKVRPQSCKNMIFLLSKNWVFIFVARVPKIEYDFLNTICRKSFYHFDLGKSSNEEQEMSKPPFKSFKTLKSTWGVIKLIPDTCKKMALC